jgi:hypothetical protein
VISATGPGPAEVDRFSLRTSDRQALQFKVVRLDLSNGGLPSAHLREHMRSGEPITVEYHVENGVNIADRYIDAIASPQPSQRPTPPMLSKILRGSAEPTQNGKQPINPTSFGEDQAGELYLASQGGQIHRLIVE